MPQRRRMITAEQLLRFAYAEGLDLVGTAPAGPSPSWAQYRTWLDHGYHGKMTYLARPDAVARREDPRRILPNARTVLVVAASYAGPPAPSLPPLHGRVSRYAWGEDYHRWLRRRLKRLLQRLAASLETPLRWRAYVDTGPVLERAWAQAAGLGWYGKNSLLIHSRLGSYLFLGVAFLNVELPRVPGPHLPSCGTCTRCIDACPTGALVAPGVLDARRCISYLTIEHRGPIPEDLRPALGTWVFGCDVCQEVCPWNRDPAPPRLPPPSRQNATLYLPDLLTMTPEEFRTRFRKTAIWRATPKGLARNAAVVLGNLGDPSAKPYLARAAHSHPSSLVREHAAWALAQLG